MRVPTWLTPHALSVGSSIATKMHRRSAGVSRRDVAGAMSRCAAVTSNLVRAVNSSTVVPAAPRTRFMSEAKTRAEPR